MSTPTSRPSAWRQGSGRLAFLGPIGPPLMLVAVMWALELLDALLRSTLDRHGIEPRELDGLPGVIFAPFLHHGFGHLLANSVPLLALGTLVAFAGRQVFWRTTAAIVLLGGLGTWLIAPANTVTIGASGLVLGYLGYLLVAGIRTRHWADLALGLGVLLVYGSLLVGALPWAVPDGISWQAHLCGALAGGLSAWWLAPSRR